MQSLILSNDVRYHLFSRRVKRIVTLIEQNGHGRLALDVIAREVNLSQSRLRHLFKSETGLTPVQYCKWVRMNEARHLAAGTFLSVKEILAKLGVVDESHFLRDFKKLHGLTITQYRERSNLANSASK